jgi:hypothetical protein
MQIKTLFLLVLFIFWGFASASNEAPHKDSLKTLDQLCTEHKKLVADHLQLSPDEAKAFWPIYEAYRGGLMKLLEERMEYVKELGDKFGTLDDDLSVLFLEKFQKIDRGSSLIWDEFMPKFIKAIGAKKTARFYQLERRIRIYLDAEVSSVLPLIR